MTHDEADHGITAWQIATEGLREIYFAVGYGREPLYDYAAALLMSFMGPTILAARLVSVFSGLILIAAVIAWVTRAFNRPTALLAGAGMAVGFWPLMSSRQALRSILLPALFVLAVLLFWLALENVRRSVGRRSGLYWRAARGLLPFITAGIILGLTFYTYIPARALWFVFPLLLLYWLARDRSLWREMWWRTAVMLLVMILVAAPLLIYLQRHPGAELRIQQLAEPLLLARAGDWQPLLDASLGSLRLFFLEGDPAWRYNLYQKPFLNPLFGLLFLAGLALTLWRAIRRTNANPMVGSASFLTLAWLAVGFAPALVTGPELSMTQAIAVQPLVYLFPAIALAAGGYWLAQRTGGVPILMYKAGAVLLYGLLAISTWRDYFQAWTNHPEVRVQYESTLVAAIDYLNSTGAGEALISTITPGPFHSPAVAKMTLTNERVEPRWFDGRGALPLPQDLQATLVLPGFATLPGLLVDLLGDAVLEASLPMRASDRDRPVQVLGVDRAEMEAAWNEQLVPMDVEFGDAVSLRGYLLQPAQAAPGDVIDLVTWWQAQRPLPDAILFSHVLDEAGQPLAQADALSYPGESWMPGEQFLQLHQMLLPEDLAPGTYLVAVGVYTTGDGRRLPADGAAGREGLLPLTTIEVTP